MECAQSISVMVQRLLLCESLSAPSSGGKKVFTFFALSDPFVSTAHTAEFIVEFQFLDYHSHWILTYTGGDITVYSFYAIEELYMEVPNMCLVKQEKALTVVNMSECRMSKGILTVLKNT